MIAERDAEAGCGQQHRGNDEMKPIDPEVPQVERHCSQREKKCADQERAGRPVNSIEWNAETQELMTQEIGLPKTTFSFVQL